MESREHFNQIASQYDYWKEKNSYYYQNLKRLLGELIPASAIVLEIGCGTGDLLAALRPQTGLGIDISEEMIAVAQRKYADCPELKFLAADLTTIQTVLPYDYIFLADVLEHIEVLPEFLRQLDHVARPSTRIIITLANPLWEPVLMLAEKLGMKMPEGPHWRLSIKQNEQLFTAQSWQVKQKGYRLLLPKKLPGGEWINKNFYKNRFLARLGFIVFWELTKGSN